MKRPRSEHFACHIAHVADWPIHAKVWAWWGVQHWVPGVVIGHGRGRVRVRVVGPAQSGFDARRVKEVICRSPNNLAARKGNAYPPPRRPGDTCLALSGGAA